MGVWLRLLNSDHKPYTTNMGLSPITQTKVLRSSDTCSRSRVSLVRGTVMVTINA